MKWASILKLKTADVMQCKGMPKARNRPGSKFTTHSIKSFVVRANSFYCETFRTNGERKDTAADESQRHTISLNNNYTIKLSPISGDGNKRSRMGFARFCNVWNGVHSSLWSIWHTPETDTVLQRTKCTMQSKHLWEWMTYTKDSWRLYVDERIRGRKIIVQTHPTWQASQTLIPFSCNGRQQKVNIFCHFSAIPFKINYLSETKTSIALYCEDDGKVVGLT